tara:strand:+ start:285 stop:1016 length:732 start_codon:yes stop_codon:yes gene_type:complete
MSGNIKDKKENPLVSIIFNIVVPVFILKNGDSILTNLDIIFEINYQIIVLLFALSFPMVYFFLDLYSKKKVNIISILGFVNVLLTGGIGVFGGMYGLSRLWFILKEGLMPFIIGLVFLFTIRKGNPLMRTFIYNEAIFNIDIIDHKLNEINKIDDFNKILEKSSYLIVLAFFFSSIIQFILATIIVTVDPGHVDFNDQVGTMTWVSYFVVMIPSLLMFGLSIYRMVGGIKNLTGFKTEDFLKN